MTLDPATLSGKTLWLRAKDLGAVGTAVTTWADQSGLGRNATVTSGSPLVKDTPAIAGYADSSHYGPSGPDGGASYAFDGNAGTYWTTNGTASGWARVQLQSAIALVGYSIRRRDDIPARNPKDWTLEGSSDGSTWTVLDTRTGITWPTAGETKSFTYSGSATYLYYRLNVSANNGDTYLSVAELNLLGSTKGLSTNSASMSVAADTAAGTDRELWIVVRGGTPTGVAGERAWDFGSSASSTVYPYTDGQIYDGAYATTRQSFTPTLPVVGNKRLYRVTMSGGTWTTYLDGVRQFAVSGLAFGLNASPKITDGWSNGVLYEMLERSVISTASEATGLIDYFNREHGLNVPATLGFTTGYVAAPAPAAVTASTEYTGSGGYQAVKAMDGSLSTAWSANVNGPGWISAQYSAAQTFPYYGMALRSGQDPITAPASWTFEGSNDGVAWTVLDTRSGISWVASENKTFTAAATGSYTYYRLNITTTQGGATNQWPQIGEWYNYTGTAQIANLSDWFAADRINGVADGGNIAPANLVNGAAAGAVLNTTRKTGVYRASGAGSTSQSYIDGTTASGGASYSGNPGTKVPSGDLTYFAVIKVGSAAQQSLFGSVNNGGAELVINNYKVVLNADGVVQVYATTASIPTNTWVIVYLTYTSATGAVKVRISDTVETGTGPARSFTSPGSQFNLGSYQSSSAFFASQVAEVGRYATVLSSNDETMLFNYLSNKYGVATPLSTGTTTASMDASIPAMTGSGTATASTPVTTASMDASIPAMTGSGSATQAVPVTTASMDASIPAMTGSGTATQTVPATTAAMDASIPGITGSGTAMATSPGTTTASMDASIPAMTGSGTAEYTAPTTAPPSSGIRVPSGSTWVMHPVKVWDPTTSSWIARPVKFWDQASSSWVASR